METKLAKRYNVKSFRFERSFESKEEASEWAKKEYEAWKKDREESPCQGNERSSFAWYEDFPELFVTESFREELTYEDEPEIERPKTLSCAFMGEEEPCDGV